MFGWRKVECLDVQPRTLQKLSFWHERTKWPGKRQLEQSCLSRTSFCLSSKDCLRNLSHRGNQWSALHKGHSGFLFSDWLSSCFPRDENVSALGPLVLCLLGSCFVLPSLETFPKIGWDAALALAVTNFIISATVTSLASLSTISSNVSRHLTLIE